MRVFRVAVVLAAGAGMADTVLGAANWLGAPGAVAGPCALAAWLLTALAAWKGLSAEDELVRGRLI